MERARDRQTVTEREREGGRGVDRQLCRRNNKKKKKHYNDLLIQIMEAKYPFFVYEFRTWHLKISKI